MSEQQSAPAKASGPDQEPVTAGKSGLLNRKRTPNKKITLPVSEAREHLHEQLMGGLSPLEMAEINKRCLVTVPDPNNPAESKVEWDGSKRQFYMIAKAMREPDGKPSYPGTQYVLGAEQVGSGLDNSEIEILFEAVQDLSGLSKRARETVGKDSARTLSTG